MLGMIVHISLKVTVIIVLCDIFSCVAAQSLCHPGSEFYSNRKGKCLPCTVCEYPLIVITPCFIYQDTFCGSLNEVIPNTIANSLRQILRNPEGLQESDIQKGVKQTTSLKSKSFFVINNSTDVNVNKTANAIFNCSYQVPELSCNYSSTRFADAFRYIRSSFLEIALFIFALLVTVLIIVCLTMFVIVLCYKHFKRRQGTCIKFFEWIFRVDSKVYQLSPDLPPKTTFVKGDIPDYINVISKNCNDSQSLLMHSQTVVKGDACGAECTADIEPKQQNCTEAEALLTMDRLLEKKRIAQYGSPMEANNLYVKMWQGPPSPLLPHCKMFGNTFSTNFGSQSSVTDVT